MASPKFTPTVVPPQDAAPVHLVVDSILLGGLALKGTGITYKINTVWMDSSGKIVKLGPSYQVLGDDKAYLRDAASWDQLEKTILEELKSRGAISGTIA